jgi:hypothetical protein
MHTRSHHFLLVIPFLALLAGACAQDGGPSSPSASPVAPSPTASPAASEPTETAPAAQTDTEWGRIWDTLPADFPRYPGATPADDATSEPVSAVYALAEGDPAEIASWMQTSLEMATYSTEGLSGPLEDESFVLESVGEADCRIQTRITPQGTLIIVTVLYGAACPA